MFYLFIDRVSTVYRRFCCSNKFRIIGIAIYMLCRRIDIHPQRVDGKLANLLLRLFNYVRDFSFPAFRILAICAFLLIINKNRDCESPLSEFCLKGCLTLRLYSIQVIHFLGIFSIKLHFTGSYTLLIYILIAI